MIKFSLYYKFLLLNNKIWIANSFQLSYVCFYIFLIFKVVYSIYNFDLGYKCHFICKTE